MYIYFGFSLVGRSQTLEHGFGDIKEKHFEDTFYIPVFSMCQFILLVGWLKVCVLYRMLVNGTRSLFWCTLPPPVGLQPFEI